MKQWAGRVNAGIGLVALCLTSGCGGFFVHPGSGTGTGTGTGSGGTVLTALGGSPYKTGSEVTALAVDKTGNYLLAAAFGGSSDLTMYSFDSATAGKLDTAASTATGVTDPTGPVAVAAGNYVYVANNTVNTLSGYAITPSTLTPVTNSPYPLLFAPTSVAVNPLNTFLYVGTGGGIYGFSIGVGGTLSALNGGIAIGLAGVQSLAISPDGNWLLALDLDGLQIDEFLIDAKGGLSQVIGPVYSTTVMTPREIKIAPNGTLVFVALGTGGDLVYTFNSANTSGALTSPVTLTGPASPMSDNALAVSPDSLILYIARSNSTSAGTVAAYAIGAGGSLTLAATGTTGVQPSSVVVDAAGTNVYVANRSDGTITGFSTTAKKP